MNSCLCLSIHFLDETFHGRRDGGELEWPPSPLRLFQALVAASAARWGKRHQLDYAHPALKWLEAEMPPLIIAPQSVKGTAYRLSVPNNAMDLVGRAWSRGNLFGTGDANPATHRAMKTVRPTRLVDGVAVHYLWELPHHLTDELRGYVETLSAAASSVVALGWGIDLVASSGRILSAEDAKQLSGEHWRPTSDAATEGLRVPMPGTLDALVDRHEAFLHRLDGGGFTPVPALSTFTVVGYRRASGPPTRRYAAFRLRHPAEDRSAVFAMTGANGVAAMIRHSMARVAREQKRSNEWIDRYVHGHREGEDSALPRFSYLPLPSIEHRGDSDFVVGAIRRVLVAELMDSGQSHLPWVRQMLPGQFLTDDKTGDRKALLTPLTGGDWLLRQYLDPSATWATVTPIVLPGSDARARKRSGGRLGSSGCPGGKLTKAEKLFFKALGHAGYSPDALAELEFRNASFWPGGEWALRFQRPDYLKSGHWSVYHVRLRWKQSIKGPLAIGAGRHCGLGIFAAINK
jgi:CRISPR-associated protein Csb2